MSARLATSNASLGRYTIYGEIASGGMATIQYGRLVGPAGFSRAVVIKRLHPQFAKDPNFVSMFLDEARLSARIAHVNVVQTFDVIAEPGELSVVMDYVHGESLAGLLDRVQSLNTTIPVAVAVTLMIGVLYGLHAAHETHGESGEPLHIVHRDVSPENILVGADGIARLLDFGIARAQGRSRVTPAGELKGKLAYMAVEQYRGEQVDRRADVYGASVVLWEALTGRELFVGETDAAVVSAVMTEEVVPPSIYAPAVPEALDRIVMRGLSRDRSQRFDTAREMALALEHEVGIISQSRVSDWLEQVAGGLLRQRAELLQRLRAQGEQARDSSAAGTRRITSEPPDAPGEAHASLPLTGAPQRRERSGLRTVKKPQRLALMLLIAAAVGIAGGLAWLRLRAPDQQDLESPVTAAPDEVDTAGARPLPPPVPTPPRPAQGTAAAPREQPARPDPAPQPEHAPAAEERAAERSADTATKPAPTTTQRAPEPGPKSKGGGAKPKPAIDCLHDAFVVDRRGIRRPRPECL